MMSDHLITPPSAASHSCMGSAASFGLPGQIWHGLCPSEILEQFVTTPDRGFGVAAPSVWSPSKSGSLAELSFKQEPDRPWEMLMKEGSVWGCAATMNHPECLRMLEMEAPGFDHGSL